MPFPLLDFKPKVIGHRGASGYAPENTMSAFIKAAQMGIKWIEFDVMLAGTGEAVVIHDDDLSRTTDGEGLVQDKPLGYLRMLDAGSWFAPQFAGERIPLFTEVLEFLYNTNISANIELKAQPGKEDQLVKRILWEIGQTEFFKPESKKLLFSSFSIDILRALRARNQDCNIALLIHQWFDGWQDFAEQLNCISVNIYSRIFNEVACQEIKEMNKYLLTYTVNDSRRAKDLIKQGCDAVFSDFPDVIALL